MRNKNGLRTLLCAGERRKYNLKELEFAVRFSSFEDSPSVYLFWVIVRGKGNLYVFPKGTLSSTNRFACARRNDDFLINYAP